MPRKCKVDGCRTGYKSLSDNKNAENEKMAPMYRFPKDIEQRQIWIDCLPNVGLKVEDITRNMTICAKHWKGWEEGKVPMKAITGKHKVPTIPPNYFECTSNTTRKRRAPGDPPRPRSTKPRGKLPGVPIHCKSEIDGWIATPTDKITNFTSFCEEAKHYLGGNKWTYELDDVNKGRECIRFILLPDLQLEEGRRLFTITVFSDMHVRLFSELTGDVPDASLSWIFANEDKPPLLDNWSQFVTLVSQCSTGVWVDGNEDNSRVCLINDLHQALKNEEPGDCEEKNADSVGNSFGKDDQAILGMTEELYKVIFQRNQLIKKMTGLQALADINMDVLKSILDGNITPESRSEMDKMSKLVKTIKNDFEINGGLEVLLPVLLEQYWILKDSDNPFKRKSASIRRKSLVPRRKPKIRKYNTTTRGEMNGNSNCAIKDEDASDQSLVVNFVQGEQQEKTQDNKNLNKNGNNDSQPLGTSKNCKRSNTKIFCKYCGKKVHQDYLNRHMLTKHNKQLPREMLLDCSVCGKQFFKLRSLNQHIQFTHRKGLPNECSICGRRFKLPSLLKKHIDVHHKEERPYQCSKCGKTFKWYENFRRHMRFVHTDEKQFRCSICGHAFKRRGCLVKHEQAHLQPGGIKRLRTDASSKLFEFKRGEDKRYYCIICNKSFSLWSYLKRHMARHSDKRDYKCSVCGNTFKTNNSLWRHIKTVHSEGTAYQCSLCPKSFKLKSRLKCHQLVHMDREPFKCTLCDKTFKCQRSLRKHQVAHSEIAPGNQDCLQHERPYVFNAPGPMIAEPRDINPLLKIRGDCLQQERSYGFTAQGPIMLEPRDINPLLKLRGDCLQQERSYGVTGPGQVILGNDVNSMLRGGMEEGLTPFDYLAGPSQSYAVL